MNLPIDISPLGSNWGGWITNAFNSFWNQVSSWDFSMFKYFVYWLLILWFVIIVYKFATWQIRWNNLMFWLDYWVKFIVWKFWTWKTKNLFQYWFERKKKNPNWLLIANIPYNFVDKFFDSKEDFDCVIKDLVQYIRDTNSVDLLKQEKEFPPILILWDEIHEYLFNRDFKTLSKDVVLLLTQCRKRNIEIDCVSQKVSQVDVFLKRLVWIFHQYSLIWNPRLWLRREYIKECINPDSNDIEDENSYEILESCILLPDKFSLLFNKDLKDYYSQRYLTYYVVWWCNLYANEDDISQLKAWTLLYSHNYRDLYADLMKKFEEINKPLPPKESKLQTIFKWLFHSNSVNEQLIEEQKKLIDKLMTMIPPEDLKDFTINNSPDWTSPLPEV